MAGPEESRTDRNSGVKTRQLDWSANPPLVSVVFISYKRVDLLARTVESFLKNTAYPELELIVSDDGSGPTDQLRIRELPFHKYVLGDRNRGLGANMNSGLAAATGDYVLVLQDDWECKGPPDYLKRAVELMLRQPGVGLVRFYGTDLEGDAPIIGDSLDAVWIEQMSVDGYSDTPHLRSRRCIADVGPYREDLWMADCEREYIMRFAAQRQYRAAALRTLYKHVFEHIGVSESHRTRSIRFRALVHLANAAAPFKARFPRIHSAGRTLFFSIVQLADRVGSRLRSTRGRSREL